MKKIRSEKGAIAALVVVTVLMFALILMGTYMAITNLRKSQLESDIRIQQLYGGDVARIEEVYNSVIDNFTEVQEPNESFSKVVTSANYGDYVDYPIDLNGDGDFSNDWKIFYNDGEHVFIIAADYVSNTSVYLDNAGTGMSTSDTYNLYWNAMPTTQTVEPFILSLFMQSWTDYSTNPNGKYVATLLNINNWDGFIDNRYADYAIGGPTLEMWIESYHEKGYMQLYTSTNTNGYYVGNTENPTTISYNLSNDNGYNDDLYFPHQSIISNCNGYWLASPGARNASNLMRIYYYGSVFFEKYDDGDVLGVRPLVCLTTDLTATKDTEGIWRF